MPQTGFYFCQTIRKLTGNSYKHRRQWLEELILEMSDIFSIDVCSYAIMSNHYHLVLHINQPQAEGFSQDEVIQRWHRLHENQGDLKAAFLS